ncbi:hypothetical protein A5634_22280 [Mycobacterium asiaticum]|uniref:Phage capsid-like C-terminal domain-containing protein n=1 Tax=Mycobacterium asiaticum TaxID=1790 RepID=A0A1A3P540_MYCAS|nr:phage major capsid protein [Mycobacterium asiaticum]OBK27707.1 hypothetical protein A5634_22280 [Mycobacterium asiaticum]
MGTPFNTTTAVKGLAPDLVTIPPAELIPEALIMKASTQAGFVDGDQPLVRLPFVAVDPDEAGFVPEAQTIDETDPDDREYLCATGKVALLLPISRELWQKAPSARLLSDAARTAVIRSANRAFLSQPPPTAPALTPPPGILRQTHAVSPDSVEESLDPVIDAVARIEADGGAATYILASPEAWAYVSKLRVQDGSNASLVGAGVDAAERRLLGLPVYVDRDVVGPSLVVADRSAVLSAVGPVNLATSEHHLFEKDSVALRITFRFGAVITWPERVVEIPVGMAS